MRRAGKLLVIASDSDYQLILSNLSVVKLFKLFLELAVRITLDDLRKTPDLTIDLLEILSIEGQRYMARLVIHGKYHLLSDSDGTTRLFRGSWQIQDTLGSFRVISTDVVHASAYNEMVGMQSSGVESMRIRVQGQGS